MTQPILTKFSVRKTEKKVVRVAQVIYGMLEGKEFTEDVVIDLVGKLSDITKHSRERISAMLGWLGRLGTTRVDAYRVALAIQGYLPCFDSQDRQLEVAYKGVPVFDVPGRFLAARAYADDKGRPTVDTVFLAMGTILAGRVYMFKLNMFQVDKLLKKVYVGRTKLEQNPHPAELSGCYCSLPSDWLTGRIGRVSEITCTAEMRSINRTLCKKRATRQCSESESCARCWKGRDQCAIAVRLTSKVKKEEKGSE